MRRPFGFPVFVLIAVAILSSACARSTRGTVVRLESNWEGKSEVVEEKSAPAAMHGQAEKKSSIEAVPTDKDDAAVFYFSLGQAYSLDGDVKHAIEAYRATLVYDPKSPLVHARLAAELVKLGSFAEAKELCEEAIRLDPKYTDSYLLLAGIQVASKEYEQSLATYRKALAVDPKNRDALLYYGVTLAETGRKKEAVQQLEILVKMKDNADSTIDQSVAHYYLAKVYQQAGQPAEAVKQLESAMLKRPGFAKAALLAAEIHESQKGRKEAHAVLEASFKENRQAEIAEKLAEMFLEENKFQDAVMYLETLVEEDPGNENMRLRLALVYWQLRWFDKARMLLTDLHERYPESSEIVFYLGELELERKETESALVYFRKVHSDYAKYEVAVGRIASIYRNEKRHDEGEEYLNEVLKKRPDLIALYPLLAAFYEEENKLPDAVGVLEQGQSRFPQDESILYYLGFLYDRMGKKDDGLRTMQDLIAVNPNNANALNFVGYTLLERGLEMKKVGEYLERAMKLKPKDAFVMDSYGWYLFKKGKIKEAMVYLERAFGAKPEEAVIAEHLADIYLAMNMQKKALRVYEKALELAANDENFTLRVSQKLNNLKSALAQDDTMPRKVTRRLPASVSAEE